MKDWEIVDVKVPLSSEFEVGLGNLIFGIADALTGAKPLKPTKTYKVRNIKSGEVHTVLAEDEEDLGRKIAKGKFYK